MLQFITKGQVSLRDQPRVYYTAHPNDFIRYFEEIRADVYRTQDCAFFYLEPDRTPDEHYYADLAEMQLFIIPVTGYFLYEQSRAYEDFLFAQEHHIPVLLLMQEPNLETDFTQKCGDLQYLSKLESASGDIPYAEKLQRYLSTILFTQELTDRIRKAFDGYIFLSYRKKDRQEARWIMSKIHQYPACRNIAIWYDAYLTPGENFNDCIAQALQKSDLFLMAVTPSLLENGNYVMQHEYPLATSLKKRILPVEIVSTNPFSLRKRYPKIPKLIPSRNAHRLEEKLIQQLQQTVSPAADNSAQKQYLIGLAYLMGIDVETDRQCAVAMIQDAAIEDLPEAVCTLADLYQYGIGVPMDRDLAAEQRIPLHRQLASKLLAKANTEDANLFLRNANSLFDLCYFGEVSRYEEIAKECIQTVLEVLRHLNRKYSNAYAFQEAQWLTIVGSDLVFGDGLGYSSDAKLAALRQAANNYQSLQGNAHLESYGYCLLSWATKLYMNDQNDHAIAITEKAIECYTKLAAADAPTHVPQLARCYFNLHVSSVAAGNNTKGEMAAKHSVNILEEFAANYGVAAIANLLLDAYDYLATFYEQTKRKKQAADLYQSAITRFCAKSDTVPQIFLEQLSGSLARYQPPKTAPKVATAKMSQPKDNGQRIDAEKKAFSLLQQGNAYIESGSITFAKQCYNQGIQIMRQITPHSLGCKIFGVMSFIFAETHIALCDALCDLCLESGQYKDALVYAKEALELQKAVAQVDHAQEDGISSRYANLAYVYRKSGNFSQALTYYNMVLEDAEQRQSITDMIDYYVILADIHMDRQEREKAKVLLDKAVQSQPQLQMEYLFHAISARNLYHILVRYHTLCGDTNLAQRYTKLEAELSQKIKNWL